MSTDDIDATAAQFATDVLAFGAHPDDVEIFCGRTVIRLIEQGYRIGVVDLTRGELASLETPNSVQRRRTRRAPCLACTFGRTWACQTAPSGQRL